MGTGGPYRRPALEELGIVDGQSLVCHPVAASATAVGCWTVVEQIRQAFGQLHLLVGADEQQLPGPQHELPRAVEGLGTRSG